MATLSKFQGTMLAALFVAGWITLLNWLFLRFGHISYFSWYINNGATISLATAFLSLIWGKLESEQRDLLAWNPLKFLATCMALVGIFLQMLGGALSPARYSDQGNEIDWLEYAQYLWDGFASIVESLLAGFLVMAWLTVVAPMFYVSTLFTGALARQQTSGSGQRIFYVRENSNVTILTQPASMEKPKDAIDLSIGAQAFPFTNAINAVVLFLAKRILEVWH